MTYIVYECDKIKFGQSPNFESEIEVARANTFKEAATIAKNMLRANRAKSFTVGCID